jgi:hypothetical protein
MSLFRDDGIVPPTKKLGEAVRIMLRPDIRGGAR